MGRPRKRLSGTARNLTYNAFIRFRFLISVGTHYMQAFHMSYNFMCLKLISCGIENETDCLRFTQISDNVFRVFVFHRFTFTCPECTIRGGQWLLWFRDFCNVPPSCFRCASVMFFVFVSHDTQSHVYRQRAVV